LLVVDSKHIREFASRKRPNSKDTSQSGLGLKSLELLNFFMNKIENDIAHNKINNKSSCDIEFENLLKNLKREYYQVVKNNNKI
jgi:hypothetical protein